MTYLAIDFGGGSGRVIAGTLTAGEDGKKRLDMQVIHRFTNRQVRLGGMDKEGADFRACKNYGPIYK